MLANPTREVRIDQFTDLAHAGAAKECAGIRNLGDRAGVQLTADHVGDTGVTADSHTNLFDNILLYDDIAEIDIADIAEVGVPLISLIPMMPVMPVRREVLSESRML